MGMRLAIAVIGLTAIGACVLVGYLVGPAAAIVFVGCILLVLLFGGASVWFSVLTRPSGGTNARREAQRGAPSRRDDDPSQNTPL